MKLSMISAVGMNNEIGQNNALLWDLPADMQHFRNTTRGKTVIMGQKTYESIGHPLPNRRNIIITLDKEFTAKGTEIVYSPEGVLKKLIEPHPYPLLEGEEGKESFVIGGGQIYKLFMDTADKLYITHVEASFPDADIHFPEIDLNKWKIVNEKSHPKDENNQYDMKFVEYERI